MLEQHEMNLKRMMGVAAGENLPDNIVKLMNSIEEMAVAKKGEAIMITGQTLLMVAAVGKLFYGIDIVQPERGEVIAEDGVALEGTAIAKETEQNDCLVEIGDLTIEGEIMKFQAGVPAGHKRVILELPEHLILPMDTEDDIKEKTEFKRETREHEPQRCEVFWEGKTHKAVIDDNAETEAGMVSVLIESETTPTLVSENNVKFLEEEEEKAK